MIAMEPLTLGWRVDAAPEDRPLVCTPDAADALLADRFDGVDREMGILLVPVTKHRMLALQVISVGSLDHIPAPREILRLALEHNGAAIIVAHSHPSGVIEPSRDDEAVTKRLVKAGELVGVDVLDHIVIASEARFT